MQADTPNPFAPPRSRVEDVRTDGETQPVKLWSVQGRIGRLRVIAWTMLGYVVASIAGGVVGSVAGATGSDLPLILMVLIYGIVVVFGCLLIIQRCHDMNWSGWASLLAIIPFVGLIFWCIPGTPGSNNYGPPPPPNPRGMGWLAALPLLLAIIGIAAAIALPAYQSYAKRAAAAAQTR